MVNVRYALRSLRRSPLVTGAAILSLALGVGANTAIFSVFEQVALRPLPVEDPHRLVNLLAPGPKPGSQSSGTAGDTEAVFSYRMFRDLAASAAVGPSGALSALGAHRDFQASLARNGETESVDGLLVSGGYFGALGLQPAAGRLLAPSDDEVPGAHPVVVLSHSYWRDRFDGDPAVAGASLSVNGLPMTVVGVAPRGFRGTTLGLEPQLFAPISMREALLPRWTGLEDRRSYWVYLFGRLAEGVSLERAQAALNVPYRGIIRDVELPLQEGLSEATLQRFAEREIRLEPGRQGQSTFHGETGPPLLLLLCVTGSVLLIACANLANLLLAQAARRSNEIAVRLSLGARRFQVIGQLMAESFLLAIAGSVLGYVVAETTLSLLRRLLPADSSLDLSLGPAGWIFLAVLALVTGAVGLVPALQGTRLGLAVALKGQEGRSSEARGANRFRAGLVTLQIALSMTLLISAGLFTRSLLNVARVELGVEVGSIATFRLSPALNRYTPAEALELYQRLEAEIAALPGVTGVSAALVPMISGNSWGSNVSVEGFDAGPDTDTNSRFNQVGPGYFSTVGIPLLAGRGFEARDDLDAPKVAIVNEAFARKFDLGQEVVGKRMQMGSGGENDIEIIGLVRDAKYSEVKQAVPPVFFRPYRQDDSLGGMSLYVRSDGDPSAILPSLRGTVARLDPNLPVQDLQTLALQVRENVILDRVLSVLSASLAVLATLLAMVGLYGVMAYSVTQRTREIGLRMALGADAARVRRLVLGKVGWMTLVGATAGAAAALALGRAARSLLFEMEGHDPGVFALSILLLAAVALAAGLVPAHRASKIEPMRALREE